MKTKALIRQLQKLDGSNRCTVFVDGSEDFELTKDITNWKIYIETNAKEKFREPDALARLAEGMQLVEEDYIVTTKRIPKRTIPVKNPNLVMKLWKRVRGE